MRWGLMTILLIAVAAIALPQAKDDGFLGRWDLTATTEKGESYPMWLEVTREGGAIKARMVGRGGSVFPLPDAAIENGELRFSVGRTPERSMQYKARLKDGRLEGTVSQGPRSGESGDRTQTWTGVHAPVWPKNPPHRKPAKPVALFNGKDLSGW